MTVTLPITGLGAVCAVGESIPELITSLERGRSGLRPLTRFSAGSIGALPVGELSTPRTTHELAALAAREAVNDARLLERFAPDRIAVVVGTTTGGIVESEAWYLARRRGEPADPRGLARHAASTVSRAVAEAIGAEGPRLTISTACSSGANAILAAADLLTTGRADAVVAGGADALAQLTFFGFSSLRLASKFRCRPFDRDRDGLNLGEGAGFVVLERALGGAPAHAFLAGGATTCDAHHMTAPDPEGTQVVAAMRLALAAADLRPEDVDYVNAHGTATPANDRAESAAISRAFGGKVPPVSSSKSFLGHTLGAAAALEAVITVLALREGLLPPTLGTETPDEGAPEDLVLGGPRRTSIRHALSNAFAFGGNNSVLVFDRDSR